MATPSANPTPITPPRVPFFDERSGLISREWYMFFLSLFTNTTAADLLLKGLVAQDLSGEFAATLQTAQLAAQLGATQAEVADLQTTVQGLALAPPRVPTKRARYGQFYDTTTQIAPAANTATVATFNTTDFSNGVRLRSPSTSEIEVDTEGIYSITVTSQMDNVGGGNHLVNTWLRVNGSNVANSAAQVRLQGGAGENHETKVWLYSFKALDYFEIGWSATDTDAQLIYRAATGVRPAIPSVYLSVSNHIQGVQ